MLSETLKHKAIRLFKILDFHSDGMLSIEDLEAIASRMIQNYGIKRASGVYQQMLIGYRARWEDLRRYADIIHPDSKINMEEWLAFVEKIVAEPDYYDKYLLDDMNALFQLIDADNGNILTRENLSQLLTVLGIKDDHEKLFMILDHNGDGIVTRLEFEILVREFFTSDDPNALGNEILGP